MISSNPIFKKDSAGRLRFWRYEVDGARWRSIAGVWGGTEVVSGWTTCTPKSRETAEKQAIFEAEAEEAKKLERVYRRDPAALAGPMMFEPMLAKKYDDVVINFPVFSQPKLDGIRCVATVEGLFSRQGKSITGLSHIEHVLKPFFAEHPDAVLDGELYNHDYRDGFEKIVSAVRKKTGHPDAHNIQYHVYDVCLGGPESFKERTGWLRENYLPHTRNTPCLEIVRTSFMGNQVALDELYAEYIELGFEGQMLRHPSGEYENKRSRFLLKRKEFDDGEFKIHAILEGNGNWAGYAKRVEFVLPDGRICGAGLKANQPLAKRLLENAASHVGGDVTIRHFGFTNDGMPRFPVAVRFYQGTRDL